MEIEIKATPQSKNIETLEIVLNREFNLEDFVSNIKSKIKNKVKILVNSKDHKVYIGNVCIDNERISYDFDFDSIKTKVVLAANGFMIHGKTYYCVYIDVNSQLFR